VQKYGADRIEGLTIGNEVNDAPTNIMQKVQEVRGHLSNAIGYDGPISTVHNWFEVMNNPILCDGDRVTINAHAYFDGNVTAENAGSFIGDVVLPNIRKVCAPYAGVNDIIITQSGWPSRGDTLGVAVPSIENEAAALASLNCFAGGGIPIFAFEADDSTWKNGREFDSSESFMRLWTQTSW
jgi:exo-beta-1,3-glucanase (GH17 family)